MHLSRHSCTPTGSRMNLRNPLPHTNRSLSFPREIYTYPPPAPFKMLLSFTNDPPLSLSLLFLKSKSLTLKTPSRSPLLASQADQRMAFLASPLTMGKLKWINNPCGWKLKISRGSCNSGKTTQFKPFFSTNGLKSQGHSEFPILPSNCFLIG